MLADRRVRAQVASVAPGQWWIRARVVTEARVARGVTCVRVCSTRGEREREEKRVDQDTGLDTTISYIIYVPTLGPAAAVVRREEREKTSHVTRSTSI